MTNYSSKSYPHNWDVLAAQVKERAGGRCERCGHPHDPDRGYMLTVHHLDGNPTNNSGWNLAALCQRCHLRVMARINILQLWLFEPEGWLIPHLEGMREGRGESRE